MKKNGFTLIELLVAIAVLGLMASIVLFSVNSTRLSSRDARRLEDVNSLVKALAFFFDNNNAYPVHDAQPGMECGDWDSGGDGVFVSALRVSGLVAKDVTDPSINNACGNYAYHKYAAGSEGCSPGRGDFFVLGVREMESSPSPHTASPGWSCVDRDWQDEFDWVTGSFEK